jgi:diguanylate cyclase
MPDGQAECQPADCRGKAAGAREVWRRACGASFIRAACMPPPPLGMRPRCQTCGSHLRLTVGRTRRGSTCPTTSRSGTPRQAAAAVLSDLRRAVGFRSWAVTRLTGQTYVIAATAPGGFPAGPGEQFAWAETLCRQVLQGPAPRVAPDVSAVPAQRDLPLVRRWGIRAYLSAPLTLDGTSLYGTLCAVDPHPQPGHVTGAVGLVDRQARLLSTLLVGELPVDAALRRAERAEAEALTDPLTGLLNRRGWELLLEREEQRCQRYGTVASVLMLDLDGLKAVNDSHGHAAGDALLRNAADVLRAGVRSTDIVARLGGDEFAMLAVETDLPAAHVERDRLRDLLRAAGVPASVGAAARGPQGGLAGAVTAADEQMYQAKNARHRPPSPEQR